MSRATDAKSEKRKFTEIDQSVSIRPHRKSHFLSRDSPGENFQQNSDVGIVLQKTVVDDESEAGLKLLKENHWKQNAATSEQNERSPVDPTLMKVAMDEPTGQPTLPSEHKDKAALRQAKSELRSKKKRKTYPVDMEFGMKEAAAVEPAAPTTDHRKQGESEAQKASEIHADNQPKPDSKQRFIVFIGNLPYTATTAAIQSHFSKLQPFTVRHSTNKETGRSRGFAFLEFEGYDKMKTCLKLFHHSLFDAGVDEVLSEGGKRKKRQARKINVELTAGGGGGKSVARKERIRDKNEKLEGERERARVHREKEEAAANRKKKRKDDEMTGANAVQVISGDQPDENIHPSRRKRMQA
ncbi:hypothetical protein EPUS_08003 [Endocarpon pusillum Z07020]|uniref:RRM domain-containing protein n=1 Tax=Endocarpon pusillum (strain Z07020 / HMAS-L-300199) TaxID=1263415 RepID=U1GWF8_ENDPU|nr:uncharacterized protein EPUS_08003 [Endocarpon pusillum Z07020]ERF76823.1 hypothetical protein EPUS_08003 [Endocarpon pusillum Z07020]